MAIQQACAPDPATQASTLPQRCIIGAALHFSPQRAPFPLPINPLSPPTHQLLTTTFILVEFAGMGSVLFAPYGTEVAL